MNVKHSKSKVPVDFFEETLSFSASGQIGKKFKKDGKKTQKNHILTFVFRKFDASMIFFNLFSTFWEV